MGFSWIELYIKNRIKKQTLCENKLFRNIVLYFPHYFDCYAFIFATFFSFPKNIFYERQDCSF